MVHLLLLCIKWMGRESIAKTIGKARKAGNLSHQAYFRMAAPGSPEAMEFFAVGMDARRG
jgi:hypothetical protein